MHYNERNTSIMGTRSAVGPDSTVKRGRYVHWDGYPSGVGKALLAIVQRDGVERAREVITANFYGWSTLDPEKKAGEPYLGANRAHIVPGYGEAYSHAEQPDGWVTETSTWGIEFGYLLGDDALHVHRVSFNGQWTPIATIPYADADAADQIPLIG